MANLIETPQWETGVYQIETTDPVVGGPDGISNIQAKQLANRTAYLKTTLESLATELAALGITDVAGLQAALDGKTPWAVADAVISAAGLTPNHANLNQLLTALQSLGLRRATESQTGVVELATAAEVLAGTDTSRAVTPAGLMNGLLGAGGVSTNDYIKIPFRDKSTGIGRYLIIQYGRDTTTWFSNENDLTGNITFPIAFPNACLTVGGVSIPAAATPAVRSYSVYFRLMESSIKLSHASIAIYNPVGNFQSGDACPFYWYAIGY